MLGSNFSRYLLVFSFAFLLGEAVSSAVVFAEDKGGRWRAPEEADVDDEAEEEDEEEAEASEKGADLKIVDADSEKAPKAEEVDAPKGKPKIEPGMPTPAAAVVPAGENLTVTYVKPSDKSYNELATVLKESRGIDEIVQAVNETYKFPRIEVVFDLCGQENAFYDPSSRRIILCYELVAGLAEGFRKDEELTDDEVGVQVIASLIFTFFHELGHAAVDVFDLPVTGNEEDAVDRFATLILLAGNKTNSEDNDTDLADSAIGSFDLDTAESLEDMDFADEHPVNEQRWFTMACLMVGSDPNRYEYLVGDNGLPEGRAGACPAEFEKIQRSWNQLLKPHLRQS